MNEYEANNSVAPCPFCGYANPHVEKLDRSICYVVCSLCGAHGPWGIHEGGASTAWNSRKSGKKTPDDHREDRKSSGRSSEKKMERITWDQNFSVGIPQMDQQHKRIIKLINTMLDATDATVRDEVISDTLNQMTSYAQAHFRAEEQLLRDKAYPDYFRQRQQHIDFLKKMVELSVQTMEHRDTVPMELLSFLKAWWGSHIMEEDRKYAAYFAEKRAA